MRERRKMTFWMETWSRSDLNVGEQGIMEVAVWAIPEEFVDRNSEAPVYGVTGTKYVQERPELEATFNACFNLDAPVFEEPGAK